MSTSEHWNFQIIVVWTRKMLKIFRMKYPLDLTNVHATASVSLIIPMLLRDLCKTITNFQHFWSNCYRGQLRYAHSNFPTLNKMNSTRKLIFSILCWTFFEKLYIKLFTLCTFETETIELVVFSSTSSSHDERIKVLHFTKHKTFCICEIVYNLTRQTSTVQNSKLWYGVRWNAKWDFSVSHSILCFTHLGNSIWKLLRCSDRSQRFLYLSLFNELCSGALKTWLQRLIIINSITVAIIE